MAAADRSCRDLGDLRPEALAAFVGRLRELRRRDDAALVLRDEALGACARASPGLPAGRRSWDVTGGSTRSCERTPGACSAAHVVPLGIGIAADRVVARAGLDRVPLIPRAVDGPSPRAGVQSRAGPTPSPPGLPRSPSRSRSRTRRSRTRSPTRRCSERGPARCAMRRGSSSPAACRPAPRAAQSLLVALDALEPRRSPRCRASVPTGSSRSARSPRDRCGIGDPLGIALSSSAAPSGSAVIAPSRRRTATLEDPSLRREAERARRARHAQAIAASGPVELACVSPDLHAGR